MGPPGSEGPRGPGPPPGPGVGGPRVPPPPARPLDRLRRRDREQLAAALVQEEVEAEERLEAPAEAAARPAGAPRDRPHAPPPGRGEKHDAIGPPRAGRAPGEPLRLYGGGHPSAIRTRT